MSEMSRSEFVIKLNEILDEYRHGRINEEELFADFRSKLDLSENDAILHVLFSIAVTDDEIKYRYKHIKDFRELMDNPDVQFDIYQKLPASLKDKAKEILEKGDFENWSYKN